MIFDQEQYLKSIQGDIPEVKSIQTVSGLAELDGLLQNIRTIVSPVLLVEDVDSGFISLDGGNLDNGYHSFYVVDQVKAEDSEDRIRALKACKQTGLKVLLRISKDSTDFGNPTYGFDKSRVDYHRVGPIGDNFYGYVFSYILRDENFKLE